MKKIIFLLLLSASSFAQNIPANQVPRTVTENFKKTFPNTSFDEWEIQGGLYNVEFNTKLFIDNEAWFDSTGILVRSKHDISEKDLPEAVQQTIKSEFAGYRVDDREKITTKNLITYKIELNNSNQDRNVVLNENGKVIQQWAD